MAQVGSRRMQEKADFTPAVYAALVDSLFQNPGPMMAGATMMALPIVALFLLVQRKMAAGLTAGAVKG